MTDWADGYVTEVDYTRGYYSELNPMRARLPILNSGYAPIATKNACELGFGQGVSVNIHAAAGGAEWWGTDFNPSQTNFARELAASAGSKARLFDESFAAFCARTDLPDFDFIGLHGVWSWIAQDNWPILADFFHRRLRIGGVLYISYNTMPGWAPMVPIRELLFEHAAFFGSKGHGVVRNIDKAVEFAQQLLDVNPAYLRANPGVAERFKKIALQDRAYLAHEYFNRAWAPIPFIEMSRMLAGAKLSYAGSANYLDHLEFANMTLEQQRLLAGIGDPAFREMVRDFLGNQQFRRDYWIKGARRLSKAEQLELLRKEAVALTAAPEDVPQKLAVPAGEVRLDSDVRAPLLDLLGSAGSRRIGEIEATLATKGVTVNKTMQTIMLLASRGFVAPARSDEHAAGARSATDPLNLAILKSGGTGAGLDYLASPVTGGGVALDAVQQIFLGAVNAGHKVAQEWAQVAWRTLVARGQKIVKDNKPLESEAENLAELLRQAVDFGEKRIPMLRKLKVV